MKNILFAATTFLTINIHAFECPNYTLHCEHKVLNDKGYFETKESKTTTFLGVNHDEPSMPANECEASISIPTTESGKNFNVVVKDDLRAFFHVSKNYGAMGPQFSTNAVPNSDVTIYLQSEIMTCVLK
jgi:hypothetical protein